MEAAHDDRLSSRAILISGELVVKLLWLIGKPCANRLVGEFFSDEFAPWERSLIDRSDGFFVGELAEPFDVLLMLSAAPVLWVGNPGLKL